MTIPDPPTKVIAGPAGHWYALVDDPQFGYSLLGMPMSAGADPTSLPPHPFDDDGSLGDWYEITDPVDGFKEIIAELGEAPR